MITPEPLLFAALADRTRLALLARLAERAPQPTSDLARATDTSRQAVTKHLDGAQWPAVEAALIFLENNLRRL